MCSSDLMLMSTGQRAEIKEVGVFTPKMQKVDLLGAGDVGYFVSSIKTPSDIKTGDTITLANKAATEMLPGYKEVRPMVFCGLYPVETSDYEKLKAALARLQLNDAAFVYSSESSVALGFGFRCGFLGLLHMEIIQERVRREHDGRGVPGRLLDGVELALGVPGLAVEVHAGPVPAALGPQELDPREELERAVGDRKSTRLNSSHSQQSRMPSSA